MSQSTPVPIALALQGGASFGAYTWGVLDALLDERRLHFEGVTGASAGALNAAALADGLARGGRGGAHQALRSLWESLAAAAEKNRRKHGRDLVSLLSLLQSGSSRRAFQELALRSVASFEMDAQTMQPLRDVLDATIDYTRIRESGAIRVFVNATNARNRTLRVFAAEELSTNVLCASSCIPLLWEPVEIAGEHYWDGSFLGNPAIYPVIEGCATSDVLLIETQPPVRDRLPETAAELISHVVELCTTAGLVRELRAIDFVSRLVRESPAALRPGLREIRVHRVAPHPGLAAVGRSSFRADLPFFHELHALGVEAGRRWLRETPLLAAPRG